MSRVTFEQGAKLRRVNKNLDNPAKALKQLGVPVPVANSYPSSLAPFLHRRIWRSTLGRVLDDLDRLGDLQDDD